MTPDIINGILEGGSALLMTMNVRRLLTDQHIAGVSIVPTIFFDAWGFWNLYYYPALDQWWSFIGGAALVLVNLTWTGFALYYGGWMQLKQIIGGYIGKIKSVGSAIAKAIGRCRKAAQKIKGREKEDRRSADVHQ